MAINDETIPSKDFYSSLNNWICHILIKLKLKYNCSNGLFTLIIAIINFIFSVIKHPLHLIFPKTLNGLFGVTALTIFNQFEIKAVCPNPKCNKRPRGLYADDFFHVFRDIIGFCGKSEAR